MPNLLEMDVQGCISCKYVMYTFIGHICANLQARIAHAALRSKQKSIWAAIFFIYALNWPELCSGSLSQVILLEGELSVV